jgi:lipopolysaccharide/colanic/teichoic acid biosynthesis glycosyltransferase
MASVTTSAEMNLFLAPAERQGEQDGPLEVPSSWYAGVKGLVDFVAALFLFIFFAPVMFLAALLVKLTSRGPAFYSQTRLGRFGQPYTIYKIRTMTHDCESLTGARWAMLEGDPRITPVGNFLRLTHLDELPQLWNVLRGDMSLVGPRPERPEFIPQLEAAIPRYRERLLVRPGVTGLAQIQAPADTDIASVRRKLAYDLYYVQGFDFWLDVRIIFGTALKVVGVRFDLVRKVCRLPGRLEVEAAYRDTTPAAETGVVLRAQPA